MSTRPPMRGGPAGGGPGGGGMPGSAARGVPPQPSSLRPPSPAAAGANPGGAAAAAGAKHHHTHLLTSLVGASLRRRSSRPVMPSSAETGGMRGRAPVQQRCGGLLRPSPEAGTSREILTEALRHISLPPSHLRAIADAMADEMAAGLAAEGGPSSHHSSLGMIPTKLDLLPDGHEAGDVFALELGGAGTLRLLHAVLSPGNRGGTETLDVEEVRLDPALKTAPADRLFGELGARLAAFVRRCGWDVAARGPPTVGFCFSFPVEQDADLGSGTLLAWTKGWACPGAVGRDVSALLADGAARAGLPISVPALVNDTVGALAAARYSDGDDAVVALVLNAGTNAAYVELLSHIEKYYDHHHHRGGGGGGGGSAAVVSRAGVVAAGGGAGAGAAAAAAAAAATTPAPLPPTAPPAPGLPRTSDLVVNVEWRGFADALLPVLPDDVPVGGGGSEGGGASSSTPAATASAEWAEAAGPFERLTGPMYLGEAARRLLARLAAAGAWFEPGAAGAAPPAAPRPPGGAGGAACADPASAARAAVGLATPGVLDFHRVCRIAADCSADLRHVGEELGEALGVPPGTIPPAARPEVRDACAALLRRSARLTAAGLAGIIAHLASEAASRPDVSATLDLDAVDVGPAGGAAALGVFGGYGLGGASFDGGGADGAGPPATPPPPGRRFVIAADGAMLRRGGRFVEELRAGLDDVLGTELASRVCVRVVDGGAALGAAAVAAGVACRAAAMGAADLGPPTARTYFSFPPRSRASTPLRPPAERQEAGDGKAGASKL